MRWLLVVCGVFAGTATARAKDGQAEPAAQEGGEGDATALAKALATTTGMS